MKTSKIALIAIAISTTMTSCENNEPEMTTEDNNIIKINAIHPSATSRATETGFENGDQIGVYVVDAQTTLQPGGNMVNNGKFEYNGSTWTSANKYYWDNGTYNIYAYYPYNKRVESTDNYIFELPADQSSNEGFSSADFLWAKVEQQTASNNAISLTFSHCMSNLVVELAKADDYEGEIPSDAKVYIHGTYTTAGIDLSNGGVTADSREAMNIIKAKKISSNKYSAIIVPQRISSRRPLVEVVCGNVSYLMEGQLSLKPGYRHTVTVTLSKSPQQVEIEIGGSINGWD